MSPQSDIMRQDMHVIFSSPFKYYLKLLVVVKIVKLQWITKHCNRKSKFLVNSLPNMERAALKTMGKSVMNRAYYRPSKLSCQTSSAYLSYLTDRFEKDITYRDKTNVEAAGITLDIHDPFWQNEWRYRTTAALFLNGQQNIYEFSRC